MALTAARLFLAASVCSVLEHLLGEFPADRPHILYPQDIDDVSIYEPRLTLPSTDPQLSLLAIAHSPCQLLVLGHSGSEQLIIFTVAEYEY